MMKPSEIIAPLKGVFSRKTDGYTAIPVPVTQEEADKAQRQQVEQAQRQQKLMKMTIGGLVLVAIVFLAAVYKYPSAPKCVTDGTCDTSTRKTWGQYSPFFHAPSEIDIAHDGQCWPEFVQVLSRHGSRYPTVARTKVYEALIDKIQVQTKEYAPGFEWLQKFKYELGSETLTTYGENEMYESGRAFWKRYRWLIKEYDPFIRSSGRAPSRVLDSARWFTRSIYEAQGRRAKEGYEKILIIGENPMFNNTLTHINCPAFNTGPASQVMRPKQNEWKETFVPPITKRLNEKLSGVNLTLDETIAFMDLCPYHSLTKKAFHLSRFCYLFSEDEWKSYDYYQTLDKWYGFSHGNPLGPTQGVAWVNELIARMTGQPVVDNTNTNRTLDLSPELFPLNATLYADFTHDNGMISIMSALGLYNITDPMPTTHRISPEEAGGFASAWTVPMGARVYIEKMTCGKGKDKEDKVRFIVNSRLVIPQGCEADEFGRCNLAAYIESLSFVRSGGRWQECYE